MGEFDIIGKIVRRKKYFVVYVKEGSAIVDLLNVFEDVKNTTNCSTGCGGCYEKVMNIISETIMGH